MRVLIVNTSDSAGGASVAARRLTEALINNGVKARMMVADKQTGAVYVSRYGQHWRYRLGFLWERVVIWIANGLSRKNLFTVSTACAGVDITQTNEYREADVIHLHWINQGMLSLGGIRKIISGGKPVVWTMHDMWPATSVCHYSHGCEKFHGECSCCPFLRFPGKNDLAAVIHRRKKRVMSAGKVHFVAVSRWLADMARSASLMRGHDVTVIPNVLSLSHFRMSDRLDSRSMLSIRARHVVIFGAARIDIPIKGFGYLKSALAYMTTRMGYSPDDLHLILFGSVRSSEALDGIPVPYTHMGHVTDEETLSQLYSASDVLVSSSLYETFGQTIIEAMACGCTPVSFDNSGQTDIIRHKQNGYLARHMSVEDLAAGIDWALRTSLPRRDLRKDVMCRYSESTVAGKYIQLYNSISGTKA